MGINLTSIAKIQTSVQNRNQASRPYAVYWTDNADLKDWTTFIDLDMVGAWNGFLFGTKRTAAGGFIQPTNDFPPVDTLANDRIFFRMRYDKHFKNNNQTSFGKIQWTTTADALFSSAREVIFPLIPDQGFKLYELDMNQSADWTGFVNSIRFFPCEDGASNDEFFLNFFEIGSSKVDFQLDNPDAGIAARIEGTEALTDTLTITKDVNDTLSINIDGFGFVDVRLSPQTTSPAVVARDLSIQLSKVALGGYVRAGAFIDPDTNKLIIQSGTRAANSSVQIQIKPKSAAHTLGLASIDGIITVNSFSGADPSPTFTSISDYRPTTFELLNFLDSANTETAFTLSSDVVVVEGGRRDFGTITKNLNTEVVLEGRGTELEGTKVTVSGTFGSAGKTFVDLNHPITDDGKLTTISFNGIADEGGSSKWKIFRPLQDGTITLINEGVIGQRTIVDNPNNGLVLTTAPGVYSEDLSSADVRVRRGDLLGLYNVSLHLGTGRTAKPDALFYELSGDASGTILPPVPQGAGDGGIPIYAVGKERRNQTVLDIDFGKRVNLDSVTIFGEETNNDLEYNISTVSSASFSADVKGEYTICRIIDFTFFTRACFTRPNVAFNIQALNDGIRFADNGVSAFGSPGESGQGGATVQGATYFYVNGDSEFLGVHELQGTEPKSYGFDRDPLGITAFFSSSTPRLDKAISRVVMYFKDPKNMRSWQIETARGQGDAGGNGSINGFDIIPPEKILAIEFDNKRVAKDLLVFTQKNSATQNILLGNPVILDVITKTGVRNPQRGVDFQFSPSELGGVNFADQATFVNVQWSKFQWEFEPIRTTGFRWFCDYHFSTKISEMEIYASAPALESFADNVQVLFSADGETFTSAAVLNSTEGQATFQLGHSPQFMRLILRPSRQLFLKRFQFDFEQDQIIFGDHGRTDVGIIEDARKGEVGQATIIPVTNNTGKTADLIVDLPAEGGPTKEILYFSHLNSASDVVLPVIGGSGRINFDEDKPLLETENAAINATAYGLKNLAITDDIQNTTDNLVPNGGFETGDLTGWKLTLVQSGTKIFQTPRVYNPLEEGPGLEPSVYTPDGTFSFGFSIDERVPEQIGQHLPIVFSLETEPIDVNDFANSIDLGSGELITTFKYAAAFSPTSSSPKLSFITSPTLEGLNAPYGTVVSPEYGSNLAREKILVQSPSALIQSSNDVIRIQDFRASIKPGTRFIKVGFDVVASGLVTVASIDVQKFFLDGFDLRMKLTNPAGIRWYKSWRNGQGDFTDASFSPIKDFTKTAGSHHWWQPFRRNANAGTPIAGQTPGFSNVFSSDRNLGIQSFARATQSDPAVLSCQWSGEKKLVGFRIGFGDNTSQIFPGSTIGACAYPRFWIVHVLKTREELGMEPDINNPAHFTQVKSFAETGPWVTPRNEVNDNYVNSTLARSPAALITTWLFDTPVITEGIKLTFTLACDLFEALPFGGTSLNSIQQPLFEAATTCPDNVLSSIGWQCFFGLSMTFLQPLESVGTTTLPLDNVKETLASGTNNVFAAVDLRRLHAVDTNSKVFELIVDAVNEVDWLPSNVIFSSSITDDPNAVVWGNTSAQSARWLRFSSSATEKYEDPLSIVDTSSTTAGYVGVERIPQGIIQSARIYPDITVPEIFAVGPNCTWQNLGDAISDNNNSTFINYSDYPIIAMDLGDSFILKATSDEFRSNHDLVAGRAGVLGDKNFWNKNDDTNFTYSNGSFRAVSDPRKVDFRSFGATAPSTSVRWVALRGNSNLRSGLTLSETNPRRLYLYKTLGGKLFESLWRPESQEPITDHPTWFRTKRTGLSDVSTITTTLGQTFSHVNGIDFGSSRSNLGDPYFPFDGKFSTVLGDIWGVQVRDLQGREDPLLVFPHKIFRLFRDPLTGELQEKTITAFKILGYSEIMYPKTFKLQYLPRSANVLAATDDTSNQANILLLSKDSTWRDVSGVSFTNQDTYQDGAGFTFILDTPVSTRGMRLFITDSEYPDDSTLTGVNEAGGFQTFVDASGPQTRVVEIVFYEDALIENKIQGTLDINHSLSATFSASSELPVNPISKINDNDLSTFWQSRSLRESITITLPAARPISRLEWIKDPNLGRTSGNFSTNAPQDFVLKAIIPGQQPLTVLSQTGFIGTTFSGTLSGAPINTDKFILEVTKVQGELEDANSIQISELRLIEESIQTEPLVVVSDVLEGPNTSTQSTKITYAANSDAIAAVHVDGMDAGADPLFTERDFFQLDLKINDIDLLDRNFGHIKLGNSREIAYRWDLKNIPNLQTGWNTLKLQFSNAADRATRPIEGGPNFDIRNDFSRVDFITEDVDFTSAVDGNVSSRVIQAPGIRFFEIEFRGTRAVPDKTLEILLHGFTFVRNRFDDVCKFNPSLYLNNSEALQIPVENIDISVGTVEFWFQPDWDFNGIVRSRDRFIPSLFRVTQTDGKFINFFYRPGTGFVFLVFDGEQVRQFETVITQHPFARFETFHLGVTWDVNSNVGNDKNTLQIMFNGRVIFGTKVKWKAIRQGRGNFVIGGEFSQTLVANPFNSTALAFTTVPTLPARHTASMWGLMENLKIYNYPKVDFSDRFDFDVTRSNLLGANELIEISLDGVNFERTGSKDLPLTQEDVLPGEKRNIYIRTNIPNNLTGEESRDASVLVTWRTPRSKCD